MSKAYKSWTIYSVGILIAWAIILVSRWELKGNPSFNEILLVFIGFFIGWLSATIKFVLISKGIFSWPTSSKSEKKQT